MPEKMEKLNQTKPQNIKTQIWKVKTKPNRTDLRQTDKTSPPKKKQNRTVQARSRGQQNDVGPMDECWSRPGHPASTRRWDGGRGWGALVSPGASSGEGRGLRAGSEPSQSTQGPDVVESSALSLLTVQLRPQRGHAVATSGLEPGPAGWPQSGCGEHAEESQVERQTWRWRRERSQHAGAFYIWQ